MTLLYRLLLLQMLINLSFVFALPAPRANDTSSTWETPLGRIRFHAEPNGRGTVGIILSCTATYIFCVWTAVHPNINVKTTPKCRLWNKMALMILSVVIPEALMVCAFGQWREARQLKRAWEAKMGDKGLEVQKQLGMDGAFFVVMGGFLVSIVEVTEGEDMKQSQESTKPDSELIQQLLPGTYTATLTPTGFLHYLDCGYINETTFDKGAIIDKGKANNIAKLLSSTQALWLIVQSLARWWSHLPVTLLEIHVLIQVLCTTFIYICWWHKPLDVDEPIEIELSRPAGAVAPPNLHDKVQLKNEIEISRTYSKQNFLITKQPCPDTIAMKSKSFVDLVAYIYSEKVEDADEKGVRSLDGVIAIIIEGSLVMLVGGLHLAAWKVYFPTTVESYLWMGASMGMILFPIVVVTIAACTRYERDLLAILWEANFGGRGHRQLARFAFRRIHHPCQE